MKTLPPIKLRKQEYEPIEKVINDFFYNEIFKPLFDLLKQEGVEVKNSNSALYDALQTGKVYYDSSYVYGSFNSSITKELKSYGAVYDRSKKAWHLPLSKAPESFSVAVKVAAAQSIQLQNKVLSKISSLQALKNLSKYKFDFGNIAKESTKDVNNVLSAITVTPELTKEEEQGINAEWSENMELYVKDWTEENIKELRKDIEQNVKLGRRASGIERLISTKYGVSQRKAKFLARQETALLTSKIHEKRYKSSGITEYIWMDSGNSNVRSRHKFLNNKKFSFDDPPVVDLSTGRKANPGEDYNCKCVARAVIP